MQFIDVFNNFISVKSSILKHNTIILYKRIYDCHFHYFDNYEIEDLTSKIIEDWIMRMKINNRNKQRISFEHEFTLLKNIINFYNDFRDDGKNKIDIIRKKHCLLCNIKPKKKSIQKELRESEFKWFLQKLAIFYGRKFELLAMIQYYCALRVSEVVALHYKDFYLDYNNPYMSYIKIERSVVYTHSTKEETYLQDGFKNGDIKIIPIFPELFVYLRNYIEDYKDKFLFIEDEKIPRYNLIKYAYNSSFKRAGLPYRGTHILRHGGCSRIFNLSGGNIIVASQLLGNSEKETIKTYAHSYNNTLQALNNNLFNLLK